MSKITQDTGIDKILDPKDQFRFITQFFENVKRLLNNGLGFGDNFDAKLVSVTFSAANTDTAVGHGLTRVPSGYVITAASAALSVYTGSAAWTASNIYLKSSATGTVSLLVF